MKKLYSAEEKQYHIEQWRGSGQSMKSYSSSAGLCYQTFYNWARHTAVQGEGSFAAVGGGFLPVGLQEEACVDKPRTELDLGGGLVLRVY